MKTKKTQCIYKSIVSRVLLIILSFFVITSCQSPELYEEEITDVVKFNIAEINYFVEKINELAEQLSNPFVTEFMAGAYALGHDPIDELEEEALLFEEAANTLFIGGMTYHQALEALAKEAKTENKEIAVAVLDNYNSTSVVLSDFVLVSDGSNQKTWSFKEIRTGIEFLFTIEFGADEDVWMCEVVERSTEAYFLENIDQ